MSLIPESLRRGLDLPLIVAPMFLVSGPALVTAACRSGVIGTFPALNQRTSEGFEAWIDEIEAALAPPRPDGRPAAPYGVNLIVHPTNPRLKRDLEICVARKVPFVITSLGAAGEVVDAIHSYGGIVFHDVISARHGEKAAAAGVDGLVAVAAGAGGHAGTLSPFALVKELRRVFAGPIALSGAMSTGGDVAAAIALGADVAYVGTRFVATRESLAADAYKDMIVASKAGDIVYTPKVSGVNANFMRQSLDAAGIDLAAAERPKMDMDKEAKAWRDVWSAGHGVAGIDDVPAASDLVARMKAEYAAARDRLAAF